jgi:hypothetical protein
MDVKAMGTVAKLIVRVLDAPTDEASLARVRGEVRELCEQFPMYTDLLGAKKATKAGRKAPARKAPAKKAPAKKAPAKKAKKAARAAKKPARRVRR